MTWFEIMNIAIPAGFLALVTAVLLLWRAKSVTDAKLEDHGVQLQKLGDHPERLAVLETKLDAIETATIETKKLVESRTGEIKVDVARMNGAITDFIRSVPKK
jgi:hypothetical protein